MKRKLLVTILCLAITVSMIACGTVDTTEQQEAITTESLNVTEEATEQLDEISTEIDNTTENIEENPIVYETDSVEDTMALIKSYGTNARDNYSVLKFQFYTDTVTDAGEYYTVKCDIYHSVGVDSNLSIGDEIEISTDETKNETHKLVYESENYLIDKDTGIKYYYNPSKVGSKIRLFLYDGTYYEKWGDTIFFSENEVLCKIFTGVIKLNKSAEVVDDLDNITGSITMENIEKSNGWFNQIAFNDSGEAMWICNIPMEYGTNVMN